MHVDLLDNNFQTCTAHKVKLVGIESAGGVVGSAGESPPLMSGARNATTKLTRLAMSAQQGAAK
jgi:hypothetical protein